ncbi:MAG: hypothetical protein V4678_02245 [Patescibacteria group bacterium]
MKEFLQKYMTQLEWGLGTLAVLLPVVAWLDRADVSDLTLYDVFPPLGLIAFGLMWTHFVMGALRRYAGVSGRRRDMYAVVSMGLVLGLIILHPGLLWIALYMDGLGLPPQSALTAYSTQAIFIILGTLGLMIFLSFELKRFFGKKTWWKYIERIQVLGMIAIFIHAIGLGSELRIDWFMVVWIFYGVTFVASVIYSQFVYKKMEKNAKQ